jgi:hypothetical protein
MNLKRFPIACLSACLLLSTTALADPDSSIFTTYSDDAERQVDFRIGATRQPGQPTQSASTMGFGYGITDDWFSELYVGWTRSGSDNTDFDSAALQNTFRLTSGQYPIDIGLYTEIEYEADRTQGYQVTFGPLFQGDIGLTRWNFNLLFSRDYLADFSNPMQLGYQWQVRRHWNLPVDFGLQGFGDVGQWNHWAPHDQQSHRLGPAIFGKIHLGEERELKYNVGLLFDVFDGQTATTLRAQAIYAF